MDDLSERAELAERAARAGGELALSRFRDDIAVETKDGKTDVVTQADRDAQSRVIEVIREEFPTDAIVGEEEDALKEVPEEGPAWVIDPIDGTSNFVRDVRIWATLWWDFEHREEYASAVRAIVERFGDMRRFGCAQATLGMVATGALDGTLSDVRPNPWDTVAGVHLVRNAGGKATDVEGERWRHDSRGLVVSNGHVHDSVLDAVRAVADR
ncbi:MAG: inositol monophosphatase [Halalkalicoccus sp.]